MRFLPESFAVRGYDVETDRDGNPYLICSSARQDWFLIAPRGESLSSGQIAEFLLRSGRNNHGAVVNFFHNQRFDFESILKGSFRFLPRDERDRDLQAKMHEIRHGEKSFRVRWIPKKYFSLTNRGASARRGGLHHSDLTGRSHMSVGGSDKATFFDTFNFWQGSLDALHKRYFGTDKGRYRDMDVEAGRERYSDEELIGRCRQDAEFTADLGKLAEIRDAHPPLVVQRLHLERERLAWVEPGEFAQDVLALPDLLADERQPYLSSLRGVAGRLILREPEGAVVALLVSNRRLQPASPVDDEDGDFVPRQPSQGFERDSPVVRQEDERVVFYLSRLNPEHLPVILRAEHQTGAADTEPRAERVNH